MSKGLTERSTGRALATAAKGSRAPTTPTRAIPIAFVLVAGAACGDPASSSDDAGPSIMQPERLDVRIAVEGADENGRLPDLECHAPLRVRFSISNLEYDEVRVRWSDLHPSTRPFAESSSSAAIDDPDDCGTVTRRPVSVAPERIRSIAPGEYEVEVDLEFERPISACTTIAECRLPSGVAALGCVGGWRSLEISAWNGGERVSWREVTSLARCDRLVVERTDPIASSRCNGVYGAQLMSDGTAVALVALPARLLTIGPTGARTGDRTLTPITTSTGDTLSSPEWFARGPDDTFWLAGEFWRDTTTCTTDAQCGPGALCDDGKGTGGSCNYGHLAVRVHPSAPTTPLEQRYLGLRVTTDVDRTRLEQDQLEIRHLARSDRLLAIGAPPEDPGVPATYEVHEMRATGSMLLPEFDGAWLVDELPESDVVALYPDRFEVRSDGGDILASVALPHADDHAAAALRLRGGQVGRLGDGRIVAAVVIGDPASVVPPVAVIAVLAADRSAATVRYLPVDTESLVIDPAGYVIGFTGSMAVELELARDTIRTAVAYPLDVVGRSWVNAAYACPGSGDSRGPSVGSAVCVIAGAGACDDLRYAEIGRFQTETPRETFIVTSGVFGRDVDPPQTIELEIPDIHSLGWRVEWQPAADGRYEITPNGSRATVVLTGGGTNVVARVYTRESDTWDTLQRGFDVRTAPEPPMMTPDPGSTDCTDESQFTSISSDPQVWTHCATACIYYAEQSNPANSGEEAQRMLQQAVDASCYNLRGLAPELADQCPYCS